MQPIESNTIQSDVQSVLEKLNKARNNLSCSLDYKEFGIVDSVTTGVAFVTGLTGVGYNELLLFEGGLSGIAFNIDEKKIGVVVLGNSSSIEAGYEVTRTGRVMDIPVGNELIGRLIDPLGLALDGDSAIITDLRLPIERPSPPIMDRSAVSSPLLTGIKVIDALIPIGHGQRELILGDRQTGKTSIALDTIINQKDKDVICIYCSIGQRGSAVAKAIEALKSKDALSYTIVMIAEANEAPGLRYIAPYAATSIGEWFMQKGKNVLIVYDDLTSHALAYRELSLLLKRPPGREAYPGDIFYIHSRLLERATQLNNDLGGGSLTALPIIETTAENISDYIPTNLISITDGQIYLSPSLFDLGQLPAIDVGKSVSRVGGKAQYKAFQKIAGSLKLTYSQFEEMELFSRFGTRLDDKNRKLIEHGKRIRACLKQKEYAPFSIHEQIVILLVLTEGLFDSIPLDKMSKAEELVLSISSGISQEIIHKIISSQKLDESEINDILKKCSDALTRFKEKE